ncbi:zinc ABC transporter substrate-binding protein [Neorhizobium lilium]|uniref:High-affinity zinc uptake system protein ZnuA n=1 Tax=Neorhizobium lilium TaxID=2503024 RepID=A0A3S3SEJ2_9HYPH|nr:zinc ABC transporter substrate-binding protein [Neorhizobium lilium]RWX78352.1 zinc ABC transporter substrate-binding protein [Neorhizobium lilium]
MKLAPVLLLASASLLAGTAARAAAPNVVVSIKPIHSLVAAIMQGVGEPKLIVEGAASPHTFNMKPSNAAALQNADLIFWIGHGMEAFLEKPLEAVPSKAAVVTLEDAPGLHKLKFREGGVFEPEADDDDGHDHDGGDSDQAVHDDGDHDLQGYDTHLWLDPMNAKAFAQEIERRLVQADPADAPRYQQNAAELIRKLDALDTELKLTLEPVRHKPFIVFHDAYQYFEHRYHVSVAGSITVSPETMPGAERISEIHKKVTDLGATCVFAEPQFEPKLLNVVTEGTKARSGVLDPESGALDPSPDLYFKLMRGLAKSLKDCLSRDA